MEQFVSRPYKLFNRILNYEWGAKNGNAYIPALLGETPEPGKPYAELWIGAHPNAPSETEYGGKKILLGRLIEKYPFEFLGAYAAKKFSNRFPFLLKVLSAEKALSIQTHPDKRQAKKLHAADPLHYPDDNHKPEIAIAIDSLTAVAGFRSVNEIKEKLRFMNELDDLTGKRSIEKIFNAGGGKEAEGLIRELYGDIMKKAADEKALSECLVKIRGRLKNKKNPSADEELFLEQYELFGADVGLLSFFFFNIVKLKPHQAVFTGAGVPHAYIKGNIIECMANSDNVVRAGLTGKYKDIDTLLDIVRFDFKHCEILNPGQQPDEVTYRTGAKEFEVSLYRKPAGFAKNIKTDDRPLVFLVTAGTIRLKWNSEGKFFSEKYSKGDSVFIPASLYEFEISTDIPSEYYIVRIP